MAAPARPVRLQRSFLAVPGARPRMFARALGCGADAVFLDCEDAVAPADKPAARAHIIRALNGLDWRGQGLTVSVRVNALDTPWMYRDLIDIVEQAGARLDTVLVPKINRPADILAVDCLLGQLEQALGLPDRIGLEGQIETAAGMAAVEAIAGCCERLEALHFGSGDFAADCQARTVGIGELHPDYPGDLWHASLQRLLVACRAHGLRAVDGPYGNFRDEEGFAAAAARVAAMGFDGKWVIHPCQVAAANRILSPPAETVAAARAVLTALAAAAADGRGAAELDGRMIDAASARMARQIVERAEAIAARDGANIGT